MKPFSPFPSLSLSLNVKYVASVGGGSDPSAECSADIFKVYVVVVLHPSESFDYLPQATSLNQQQRRTLEFGRSCAVRMKEKKGDRRERERKRGSCDVERWCCAMPRRFSIGGARERERGCFESERIQNRGIIPAAPCRSSAHAMFLMPRAIALNNRSEVR